MRRAFPTMIVLMTFAMLGQVGGAMLSASSGLEPVALPAHRLVADYPFDLGTSAEAATPVTDEVLVAAVPEPVDPAAHVSVPEAALDLGWILPSTPGPTECRPPFQGSICLTSELQAPEPVVELDEPVIPRVVDPYDLVPDRVRSVEDWRPLVAHFFKAEHVDRALRIVRCESRGDPGARNTRSSASGLFQHLRRYWPVRAAKAGYPGASVFDPVANVAASAYLVYEGGGWSHWTCRG
ncbi:MAG: hypothetical protein R6X29_03395 [Acidimicrobiia bacterium]